MKFRNIIKYTVQLIWHYSGCEFIYRKFVPPKNSEALPTGFVWLISIYIALFGIAFNRYESRKSEITNLANNLTAQLTSKSHIQYALSQIPDIQWRPCPSKPNFIWPPATLASFFGKDQQCEDIADYLKNIVVDNRKYIGSVNLSYSDLRGTVFMGSDFTGTNLMYSKLEQAVFVKVDFYNSQFFNAKFDNAWFQNCSFEGANLRNVNFEGAFFSNCNLESAKGIELNQLLECKSLYQCKLKPEWEKFLLHPQNAHLAIQAF